MHLALMPIRAGGGEAIVPWLDQPPENTDPMGSQTCRWLVRLSIQGCDRCVPFERGSYATQAAGLSHDRSRPASAPCAIPSIPPSHRQARSTLLLTDDLTGFIIAGFALTGSPGPATLSLAATAAAFGIRNGVALAAGCIAGVFVVMLVTASGLAGLVLAQPVLGPVVRGL